MCIRDRKKAQEKIAKHKVEIDILAGLVRDGLLKVEDAAPRVEMTVEEFEAAMPKWYLNQRAYEKS